MPRFRSLSAAALSLAVLSGVRCTQEPARTLPDMVPSEQMRREPSTGGKAVRSPTRAWPPFPAMLWFDARAEHTPEQLAELRALGIDGVHVNGTDSPEAVAAAGMAFYTGDASGKGVLHLRQGEFDSALEPVEGKTAGPQRPSCFNQSPVFSRMVQTLTGTLSRHLPCHPLGIALEDEISTTHGVDPADFCYCDWCLRALRAFLRKKYRSVDSLRAAWQRPFVSFDNALPDRTADAFKHNKDLTLDKMCFTSWSDHREFYDRSLSTAVRTLIDTARQADPAVPVGVLGGRFPSAFGGAVWSDLAPACTFLEVYPTAGADELARSYAPLDCRFVSTLFLKGSEPQKVRHDLYQMMARGDDGVILFWYKDFYDSGKPSPLADSLLAPLESIRRVRATLATFRRDPGVVAILDSQESIRAGWLVDASQDGDTFDKRLTSYETNHNSAILARLGWMRLLEDLRLPYHFISSDDVRRGGLRNDPPRAVILSRALALSDRDIRELSAFVEHGGLLIADSHLGLFDEELRGRKVPAMDGIFALSRDTRPITLNELAQRSEVTAEFGLALGERGLDEQGPSSRQCAILKKYGESGCTLFLNLDLANYKTANPRTSRLRELMKSWFRERGIVSLPSIEVGAGPGATRVTAHHFRAAGAHHIVTVVADEWKAEPVTIIVQFPDTTPITELVSGAQPPAANRYTFELKPDSALVLEFTTGS